MSDMDELIERVESEDLKDKERVLAELKALRAEIDKTDDERAANEAATTSCTEYTDRELA